MQDEVEDASQAGPTTLGQPTDEAGPEGKHAVLGEYGDAAEPGADAPPPVKSEAQSIIADALAQASLVTGRAEQAADALLADAREDAERYASDGRAAARVLREQAEAIVAAARQRAADIEAAAAEAADVHRSSLGVDRAAHDERLAATRTQFETEQRVLADTARAERGRLLDDAHSAANEVRAASERETESARQQADALMARAESEAAALLDEARATVAAETADAAEQTAWTKQTMADLLAAAEVDAEAMREKAQADADAVTAAAQLRAAVSDDEVAARREAHDEFVAAQRAEIADEHRNLIESANTEGTDIRQRAGDDAEAIVAAAEKQAVEAIERAQRRENEAEAGAKAIREQASNDLARMQGEARELRRRSQDEAGRVISEARAEADELRSSARSILAEARAEVAVLTTHRDEITKQLGDLSGVINALALADRGDGAGEAEGTEGVADDPTQHTAESEAR